jgi:hypothetical protein
MSGLEKDGYECKSGFHCAFFRPKDGILGNVMMAFDFDSMMKMKFPMSTSSSSPLH